MSTVVNAEKPIVWVIEDESIFGQVLTEALEPDYAVTIFSDLAEFQRMRGLQDANPRLLIADLVLPDGNFLDFIGTESWRKAPLKPFLIVSSMTDIVAMRKCIDEGAHDFITKPAHSSEILLKVECALRSTREISAHANPNRPVLDQLERRICYLGKNSEPLTIREMQILNVLLQSFGQPVTRQEITRRVWTDSKVSSKSFDVHLGHLREKSAPLGLEISLKSSGTYCLHETENKTASHKS